MDIKAGIGNLPWRRTILGAVCAAALAGAFGAAREKTHADASDFAPSAVPASCNGNQVEYWAWDSYAKTSSSVGMWVHRCISAGGTVLAGESDLVALPAAANASVIAPVAAPLTSLLHVEPAAVISGMTTPTESAAPSMSDVVTGWLKKSSTCPGYDPNTMSPPNVWPTAVGCDHGDTLPTLADAKADDLGGSVGIYTMQATTKDGLSTISFVWDVSRWAKGDIFAGIQDNFLKVFDRDMNFKRYIALSDAERHANPVQANTAASPTGDAGFWVPAPNSTDNNGPGRRFSASPDGNLYHNVPELIGKDHLIGRKGPKGCAVNFRTGEVFFANFDYYDPGLNFVGRQPGDTSPGSAHGDLDYSDLSRRFSTERYRQNDNPARRNVIDASPESIKFDFNMNLYVGHEQPWLAANGDAVDMSSPDDDGAQAPEGHKIWNSDDGLIYRGVWDPAYTGGTQPVVGLERYADTIRIRKARYGLALQGDPEPGSAYGYWEDISVPYISPDANPFAWLLDTAGNHIPFPRVLGRGLHRYVSPSKQGNDWTRANTDNQYFMPFVNRSGVDWIDLSAPARDGNGDLLPPVVFYTTQSGDIHKFDTRTGTQLGDWNVSRLFRSELHAMRLLPPGDGTDILVLALDLDNSNASTRANSIMRIQLGAGGVATPVQRYIIKDNNGVALQPQPAWKDMDVSPDGRTFVATAANSSSIYRFDVETGAYVIKRTASETNLASRFDSRSVCVMWQYSTQQEICGNGIDDDGDGIVDNACSHVPTNPDAVVAHDDAYTTRENVALNSPAPGVLGNDGAAIASNLLVATLIPADIPNGIGPLHGTVSLNTDGSFVYTPQAGYHGADSFQYTAAAGSTLGNTATVNIVVTPLMTDDGPFSVTHHCTAGQCDPLTINGVLANDSNNSTPMSVVFAGATPAVAVPVPPGGVHFASEHGADVQLFPDGHFIYTPTAATGTDDHFFYRAADAYSAASNTNTALYGNTALFAKVTILILNSPPVATPDEYSTFIDVPIDYKYAPCLGVQPIVVGDHVENHILPLQPDGSDCVPQDAANLSAGLLNVGVMDSDPEGDLIGVTLWSLGLPAMPTGTIANETWRDIPADGGMKACSSLAKGFTDAFCHTEQGGTIEVWSDGRFRYFPRTGFTGDDAIYYRITDGGLFSNWAKVTIHVNPLPALPKPIAVGNAYETTTGFNLDVHYPPCFAVPGQIEGLNYFPSNARSDCPPATANNPNAVNGLIGMTRLQTGYVDADKLDNRGVQVLQFRNNHAPPAAVGGNDADWSDDLSALRIHSWGEKQADMSGSVDLGTWQLPSVGDDVNVCRGMAKGTTDAYCPTKLGGLLEVWEDGTFRYQPPDLATPQPDWFWYRVKDGHNQVSDWARVTINVRAKMLVRPVYTQRAYGSADPNTSGVGYYDFLLNGGYTDTPQSIARPDEMSGSISCTAWADGTQKQPHGTVPVSMTTPVGLYPITCEGEDRPGYEVVYQVGELRITQIPLKVKADNKTKIYNGHPYTNEASFTASYEGFVNNDGPSSLGGSLVFSGSATAAFNANTPSSPTYTIELGGYTSTNYSPITYELGQLVIARAPLTVRAEDKAKDYDGQVFSGGYTSTYEGFVNNETPAVLRGSLAHTGAALTAVNANTVEGYAIIPGGQTSANYDINYIPGALRIRPVGVTVLVADQQFAYDGNTHETTCTVAGAEGSTLAGTLSYAPLGVKNAGVYAATCTFEGDQNHTGPVTRTGAVTIKPIPLHIRAGSGSKTYGSPFSVTVESYSGFIAGENAGSALSTPASCDSAGSPAQAPVSGSPYSTSCSGAVAQNYVIDYAPGTLTLGRKSASVTPNTHTKVYGNGDPVLTGVLDGFLAADNITPTYSRANGETVNGGPYVISATLASPALANYDVTYRTSQFSITARPLTVQPDSQGKKYGKANPVLKGTITGIAFNDQITASYSTTAAQLSSVGDYPITSVVNATPAVLSNYTVTINAATLNVQRRQLKLNANDKSRAYGDPNPDFDGVLDGNEVGTDTLEALQLAIADGITPTYSTDILPSDLPGGYADRIYADVAPNEKLSNYHVQKTKGRLTITARAITVKADPKTKFYGDADPGLTYQVIAGSLLPGDSLTGTLSRTPGVDVGTYAIARNTLAANDKLYTLTYVPDNLLVSPRPVTISAQPKSKKYGNADPALTYAITDGSLVGTDTFTGALTRDAGETVSGGPYTIRQGTVGLTPNYTLTYVAAPLTIDTRPLRITAASFSRMIGAPNPTLTGFIESGSPFAEGGIAGADMLAGNYATTATLTSLAGEYPIAPSFDPNPKLANYGPITYVNGILTIFANRPPVAEDDFGTTIGTTPVTVSVLPNDHDPDEGGVISLLPQAAPYSTNGCFTPPMANGVVTGTLTANCVTGTVTYTAPVLFKGTVTFSYIVRDQVGDYDSDTTHADNSVGVVTINVLPNEVCYVGNQNPQITAKQQYWNNQDGSTTIRTYLARNFNDNTYGASQIGWLGRNHSYSMLVTSDMVQIALYDKLNFRKMEYKQDYLSADKTAPSGYRSLGVSGGDGAMVLGNKADVVAWNSSLAVNLNNGGIVGGDFDPSYVLTTNSPATDAAYTPNQSYPNWIFDVWFETTVSGSALGAAGFGYPRITAMHASPSKTGVDTEPVSVVSCVPPAGAPVGTPDYYEVNAGKTLTVESLGGVLANDVDPQNKAMTAVLMGGVTKGALTFKANGTFTYKAPISFTGVVTFGYRPKNSDGSIGDLVIVSITVK